MPRDTFHPSTFQNEKPMPVNVMNPFLHRSKGKSGVNVKDTCSNTTLFLIINLLLILRQTDMAKFKGRKKISKLELFFPINNLKGYYYVVFQLPFFFFVLLEFFVAFFQILAECVSM